jgi:hypothetical protein
MPVLKNRVDDAYYAPLATLVVPTDTELYLGLIHHDDNEKDRMRITAEHNVVPKFSIASECGWTRTNSEPVPGPTSSHRLAAQNLSKTI